jgi:hypothetical protein
LVSMWSLYCFFLWVVSFSMLQIVTLLLQIDRWLVLLPFFWFSFSIDTSKRKA